jgi:hypothetical protein
MAECRRGRSRGGRGAIFLPHFLYSGFFFGDDHRRLREKQIDQDS